MPEAAVHETTVAAIVNAPHNQPKGAKADAVVLTNENFPEYVDKALAKPQGEAEVPAPEKLEDKAAAEVEKLKADAKKAKGDEAEEIDHPDKDKKSKLNERFGELTAKRKAAEAKAADEAKARQAAEQRAEEASREAAALKAKYEPPKSDVLGPEPQPEEFTDTKEFASALKDWTAEKTLKDAAAKREAETRAQEQERIGREWKERQEAARKEIPDYEETINASTVKVSDQMRDAIVESEVGPKILHHLAKNPELADSLGKMTVGRMLKEIGKLEATLAGGKAANAAEQKQDKAVAEISRAPAPISPLNGSGASPVLKLNGHQEVPKNWTYEDWKKARRAGQIQ